jgi:hypothetical protein
MRQVIFLPLGSTLVRNLVSDWHVSIKESLSDHRYICFKIESQVFETVIYGNPKECNRPFSCPTITTAGIGLLIHQGNFLGGLKDSASLGRTQEGSLIELKQGIHVPIFSPTCRPTSEVGSDIGP